MIVLQNYADIFMSALTITKLSQFITKIILSNKVVLKTGTLLFFCGFFYL